MATLRIGLLGSFQACIAGAPIRTFESDKARALLAYLAVESDRPHRRSALIGLFWPNCPEQTARHNLRQTLCNLRQALGDPLADHPHLIVSREEIQFDTTSDYWLDVANFQPLMPALQHRPNSATAYGDYAVRAQQALGLYRGRFMQGFFLEDCEAFEEWVRMQSEALHLRALQALSMLTSYCEQCGDYDEAQRFAWRQLELDPWREEAHCQLMRVLALGGQRSAALMQYKACRRVLVENLGIEPAAETKSLYERIKNERSWICSSMLSAALA